MMTRNFFAGIGAAALCAVAFSPAARAASPSGSLPVLYISTEGGEAVTSKDVYLDATYYLDPSGVEGVGAVGSASEPLPLKIKGRGNYTWVGFDKKPYRLKLDSKAALAGMKKSKHFALLAHADDNLGFMRNAVGMELARRMGLDWTPAEEPVEVVLNGDYIGLYFLTETIRVDKDRVNIVEQADNETDPVNVTGGWLVEIDNYDSDPHVEIYENGSHRTIFTYKTPEALSEAQENYLKGQMQAIDDAVYAADKSSGLWQSLVDIDQLARYYVVQEIMDDTESFHGSCYLHKDLGDDTLWKFGPVWDFGNAFCRGDKNRFIYQEPAFHQTWIGEMALFPAFQEKVRGVWEEFAQTGSQGFYEWLDARAERLESAARSDGERWPRYSNADMQGRAASFRLLMKNSLNWLGQQWGARVPDTSAPKVYLRGSFNGWGLSHPFAQQPDGTYCLENLTLREADHVEFKLASEDWSAIDYGAQPQTPFRVGTPYLLQQKGDNLTLPRDVTDATAIFDPEARTLLIEDAAGVISVAGSAGRAYVVRGNSLTALREVEVYDASGIKIFSGTGTVRLERGLYIVRTPEGTVDKVIAGR